LEHPTDTCVAVFQRILESTLERGNAFVNREIWGPFAPIDEEFGACADCGNERLHKDLVTSWGFQGFLNHGNLTRGNELDGSSSQATSP
jgi:hypothetical protein